MDLALDTTVAWTSCCTQYYRYMNLTLDATMKRIWQSTLPLLGAKVFGGQSQHSREPYPRQRKRSRPDKCYVYIRLNAKTPKHGA